MLTHRNLVANVAQIRPLQDVAADDRVLAVLPFFHIYGMTVLLNAALHARARLVIMPSFDLARVPRATSQNHKVHVRFIAPPVAVALAKHPLGRQLRPVEPARHHVRRRAAGRGSRPRRRRPARLPAWCRATA